MRAFRGLVLGLALSLLNLAGAFLTLLALGGLGDWSGTQFLGCFGVLELATGAAFLVCPNIWRMPVAEANTPHTDVKLAASAILIPHWAAGVKAIAGIVLITVAARSEGVGPSTPALLVEAGLIAIAYITLSLLFARYGVARPDLDVLQFTLKRPGHEPRELPGLSIGAMVVQTLLNIGAFPAVKLLPPSVLFSPEFGPSPELLAWTALTAAVLSAGVLVAWWGRIAWQAPPEQQREAEEFA